MSGSIHLFKRTKELEHQIDSYFDKVAEAKVVF